MYIYVCIIFLSVIYYPPGSQHEDIDETVRRLDETVRRPDEAVRRDELLVLDLILRQSV